MIQFELDNDIVLHMHWLRDRRFGKRAEFNNRTMENLSAKYKDLTGAVFNGAVIRGTDFEEANLTDVVAHGAHFDGCNFKGTNLRNAHFHKALFTNCTIVPFETELWEVTGNGTQIITLHLDGYHVVYTSEILQINCKQFLLSDVWWHNDDEILRRFQGSPDKVRDAAIAWWHKWRGVLQEIINKSPAEKM